MKALHLLLAATLAVPLALHAQGKDPLVLSSFEGDLARQWGGVHTKLETEKAPAFVKEGDQSGRWSNLRTNMWLTLLACPADWSSFDTLTFWMHADKANGEEFRLTIDSQVNQPEKGNYFIYTFRADWTGWKQLSIPFSEFKKVRAPEGWQALSGLQLSPARREIPTELVFHLDDMKLVASGKPAPAEKKTEAQTDTLPARLARIEQFATGREGGSSRLVETGNDGRLRYTNDEDGNRLCDFSYAGYKGGGVAIPDVPAVVTVQPTGGDDTAALQAALDRLAVMPLQTNGFRGALQLAKGKYVITNSLFIRADGMVVRGAGAGFGGSWMYHRVMPVIKNPTGTGIVHVPNPERGVVPTFITSAKGPHGFPTGVEAKKVADITTDLVPAGTATFAVSTPSAVKAGDEVVIVSRQTQKWVKALELGKVWKPETFALQMVRTVTSVDGQRITLNVPVTTRIDARNGYATGEVWLVARDKRLRNIGIEDLLFLAGFDQTKKDKGGYYNDENHPNQVARIDDVRDGWLRRCVGFFYSFGLVGVGRSMHVTVEDCAMLDGVSRDTPVNHAGARKYYYNLSGDQVLVQRSYARYARHAFIGNGPYDGGVFLDCFSERDHLPSEWHQGWGHGHLFDSIALQCAIQMNGAIGEHGQKAAFALAWNCLIDNRRTFEADLAVTRRFDLCNNYAIGNTLAGSGQARPGTALTQDGPGTLGSVDSSGKYLLPRSLYLAQLHDRLGANAVKAVATKSQIAGAGGIVWKELATAYSELPLYADPDTAPWPGLENWVVRYPDHGAP